MTQFPTLMYRVPGPHKRPHGVTYDIVGAKDQEEFARHLDAGWHPSLDDALAPQKAAAVIEKAEDLEAAIDEISPPTRDELETKAKELGVSFNARTKDEVLLARISEKLGG